MKRLLGVIAFFAVLSLSLVLACGKSAKNVNDRVDLVPQTADLVGHIKLSETLNDADIADIYAALPKEAGDPQTLKEALAVAVDMPCLDLASFEEGWIFGNVVGLTTTDKNYAGAILRGTFEETTVLNCARAQFGAGFTSIDCQGYTIYTGADQQTGLAIVSGDLLAVGSISAIKDVIAVKEGSAPALDGRLLEAYDDMGDVLLKVAATVPPGQLKQEMQDLIAGGTQPPAMDALDDLQVASVAVGKNNGSVTCQSQLFFSNKGSANDVKGWIPLVPLMVGGMDIANKSVVQNPEDILAVLPQILDNGAYDCRVTGSRLTISADLTVADVEGMTEKAAPIGVSIGMAVDMGTLTSKGLDVSVDATINNHIGMKFDIGDLHLAAVSHSGQTYVDETIGGSTVGADSAAEFRHGFVVPLELVSENSFVITVDTTAKARGAKMPLTSSMEVTIPDLDSIFVVPVMDVGVNFGQLTPDGLQMHLQAAVPNRNPFGINMGDLQILTKDESGDVVLKGLLTGSTGGLSIAPNSTGTLSGDLLLPMDIVSKPALVITVETQAGLAGISLPITANVKVAMPDINSLATVPEIGLGVGFGKLTSEGLHIGLQATVPNSNPFGIDIGDLSIVAEDQSGNVVSTSSMAGCSVGPDSTGQLSGDLLMPLSVLDEPAMTIRVRSQAGFAGISMPVSGKVVVAMPDMNSLFAVPGMDLGVNFGKLTSEGLYLDLQTAIANSNPFGIEVDDVHIVGKTSSDIVLFTTDMKGCSIGPGSTSTLSGEILMPLAAMNESSVVITVQTRAGIGEATLPLSAKLTVNMPDIGSLVAIPKVKIWTNASWESSSLLLPNLCIDTATTITNKADFALKIGDISAYFINSNDELVHEMRISGGTVDAHCSKRFYGSATLCASEYMSLICGDGFRVKICAQAGISGVDAVFPVQAEMTTELSSLFQLPELDLDVDIGELGHDGVHVEVHSDLCNPNLFGIDIEDLQVVVTNKSGEVLYTRDLDSLTVGPDSTGTCLSDLLMPLDILNESKIAITIEGQAKFFGVTMPVKGRICLKVPDIRSLVAVPETDLDVDSWELEPDGLHMGLRANVTNPNPFGIDLSNLQIVATSRSGNVVSSNSIGGCSIEPNSSSTISSDLLMPLGVLDRSTLVIKMQTKAGFAEIALPVNAKMTIKMPDIRDLFAIPQASLGVAFGELRPDGLPVALQATITNPNPFGIDLSDLQIVATNRSGDVILTSNAEGCAIEPNSAKTVSVDLLLPTESLDEPTIVITVQSEAGYAGITLPFSENLVLVSMPHVGDGAGG